MPCSKSETWEMLEMLEMWEAMLKAMFKMMLTTVSTTEGSKT